MDKISVIIRNRNEEEFIGTAIQSVVDYFDNPEIVVIDNQSTDESMKVVSLFDRYNIVTHSINGMYTPGRSINLGVQICSNDIILILSAHSQITRSRLSRVQQDLENHVAVFGNQIPIYKGKRITKRYVWSHFNKTREQNLYSKIEDRYFLHNAFCFYKRQTLLDNPFNEKLSGKEDRYWAIDMVDKGYTYLYDGLNHECNHFWTTYGATWKGIG